MKRLSKRQIVIVILSLTLVYSAGYVAGRVDRTIVHYTATAAVSAVTTVSTPGLHLAAFYTPLRSAELAGLEDC